MTPPQRIASIQHGDYRQALRDLRERTDEPYFGMRESVGALETLLSPHEGLVVSLDAPAYDERRGNVRLVGAPTPAWCARVPRLRGEMRARLLIQLLEEFEPTHVLLRVGDQIGFRIAQWCARREIPTLVVLANAVWSQTRYGKDLNRRFMRTLGHPTFSRVYNYKPTACLSMRDYGLDPAKIFAYEFGGERSPEAYAPKRRARQRDCHLVFAGRMTESKGPLDVVDAVRLLRERGVPAHATLFGDGELLRRVRERAARIECALIRTPGWVDNDTLFETFRSSTFVCVPTHPSFVEGMPMALTEALASRTPVIASDCEVFTRSFRDGEGVRFFTAKCPEHLAQVVAQVWSDARRYDDLSESTLAAFERVSSHRSFADVIDAWRDEISGAYHVLESPRRSEQDCREAEAASAE